MKKNSKKRKNLKKISYIKAPTIVKAHINISIRVNFDEKIFKYNYCRFQNYIPLRQSHSNLLVCAAGSKVIYRTST